MISGIHAQILVTKEMVVKSLDIRILNLVLLSKDIATCKYACFGVNHLTGPFKSDCLSLDTLYCL